MAVKISSPITRGTIQKFVATYVRSFSQRSSPFSMRVDVPYSGTPTPFNVRPGDQRGAATTRCCAAPPSPPRPTRTDALPRQRRRVGTTGLTRCRAGPEPLGSRRALLQHSALRVPGAPLEHVHDTPRIPLADGFALVLGYVALEGQGWTNNIPCGVTRVVPTFPNKETRSLKSGCPFPSKPRGTTIQRGACQGGSRLVRRGPP